ncbi:MAG: DNA topoisomerase IV subunit A [Pseudomonadota bacterium]|nr:DNA topoisomerase IV subunit A [Pseudomonadota bacterium]
MTVIDDPAPPRISDRSLADALSERYLAYALSTITARSLPDVRDGLKPVHRRLLHAMRQLRLGPGEGFKKSARVVGDVMGKYHPHGDAAIYDAMVRLAQDFAQRYPLVDGQGNFGNIDGDNAAAMRYTEARMTTVAERLLAGIDEDAVDFRPTYDGSEEEPVVLPANFPNLLANGAQGIAVGMATAIPPHNVDEICGALLHLIKHPNAAIETLVTHIQGPDFPTGGVLVESAENILEAYHSGRGGFRLRARWEVEKGRAGTYQIVITEIPYQVQKSRVVEKIAELLNARKLVLLADVRDESAEDIRLVLEPKSRNVDPAMLMESVFRQTDLDLRVSLNMNVLDADGVPRVMNLREVVQAFLDHRHDVLVRRSRHRLAKIDHRLEVLQGYLTAYLNLDEVIAIIREADDAKAELIARFELSEVQAEAILNMRLRALRRLEEIEIRKEFEKLTAERADLLALLDDQGRRWRVIADEIRALRGDFPATGPLGRRRTEVGTPPSAVDVPPEAIIDREPVTVVCSLKGWVRAMRGHVGEEVEIKYKEGDGGRFKLHAETTDKLLVFASDGRFYTLGIDKLPGGRGHGEPIRLLIELAENVEIVTLRVFDPTETLLVASDDGRGFQVAARDVVAQTKNGRQVLVPAACVRALICAPIPAGADHLAVVGGNRKLLVFPLVEVPTLTRGKGVILQRYKADGKLADARAFTLADGLSWSLQGGRQRTVTELDDWRGKRAGAGRVAPNGFPRPPRFT